MTLLGGVGKSVAEDGDEECAEHRHRDECGEVERDRRIDYILVGPMHDRGPGSVLHARVVLDLPAANEVYASDHFGVFAEISLIPPEGDAW